MGESKSCCAADMIVDAIKVRGTTQKELAEKLGILNVTFNAQLNNNTMRAQTFVDAADTMGYRVALIDMDTGEEMSPLGQGHGTQIRKMVDGIVYDTKKASAICHSENRDGWWMELYRKPDGECFVVHYTNWSNVEPYITRCPAESAEAFVEMYGGH